LTLPTVIGLGKLLRAFGAQVVHAHDLGPWLNAAAAWPVYPGAGLIATFHQLSPPQGRKRALARAAAVASRALVACGSEVERELLAWAPKRARVVTIGNGVVIPKDVSITARKRVRLLLGIPEHATAVGYLGRMHEEKGPDRLLEAFLTAFQGRKDVLLFLIGSGPLLDNLKHRTLGLAHVRCLGEVTEGANELLLGLDIYAQASMREGRSLAMMEAMAAGLPTVAHELAAVAEIHSARTALLVRPGDKDAFSMALRRLVDDRALRARMGAAAREKIQAYSVDDMVSQYTRLYRGLPRA
jgi:glycosyltransferase involved in cell wall biosynthesis